MKGKNPLLIKIPKHTKKPDDEKNSQSASFKISIHSRGK